MRYHQNYELVARADFSRVSVNDVRKGKPTTICFTSLKEAARQQELVLGAMKIMVDKKVKPEVIYHHRPWHDIRPDYTKHYDWCDIWLCFNEHDHEWCLYKAKPIHVSWI